MVQGISDHTRACTRSRVLYAFVFHEGMTDAILIGLMMYLDLQGTKQNSFFICEGRLAIGVSVKINIKSISWDKLHQ